MSMSSAVRKRLPPGRVIEPLVIEDNVHFARVAREPFAAFCHVPRFRRRVIVIETRSDSFSRMYARAFARQPQVGEARVCDFIISEGMIVK